MLRTGGPKAREALKNTQAFARIGIGIRGQPVPVEALDLASRRLEVLFNIQVLPLEDQISRAVRAHIPGVLEAVAALPERLRLLALPGAERALGLRESLTDLLRNDAGSAAMVLGSKDGALHEDITWAKKVGKALGDGRAGSGESDIREARRRTRALGELTAIFPMAAPEAASNAIVRMGELLGDDRFHEHLADVRAAVARFDRALVPAIEAERLALDTARQQALAELQELDAWTKVWPEVREQVTVELTQAAATKEATPSELMRVAIAGVAVPGRLQALHKMLVEAAAPPPEPDKVDRPETPEPAPAIAEIAMRDLLPASASDRTIRTSDDVDRFSETLRAALATTLEKGAFVIVRPK